MKLPSVIWIIPLMAQLLHPRETLPATSAPETVFLDALVRDYYAIGLDSTG